MDSKFVVARRGTAPILLAAPHGGRAQLQCPRRRHGTTTKDKRTFQLTEELEAALSKTGLKPHVVLFKVSRKFVDANRAKADALEDSAAGMGARCGDTRVA